MGSSRIRAPGASWIQHGPSQIHGGWIWIRTWILHRIRLRSGYRAPGTGQRAPSPGHQAPNTGHQAPTPLFIDFEVSKINIWGGLVPSPRGQPRSHQPPPASSHHHGHHQQPDTTRHHQTPILFRLPRGGVEMGFPNGPEQKITHQNGHKNRRTRNKRKHPTHHHRTPKQKGAEKPTGPRPPQRQEGAPPMHVRNAGARHTAG